MFSLQTVPAQDSTAVVVDSTNAFQDIGSEMSSAVDLIASGEISTLGLQMAQYWNDFLLNVLPSMVKALLLFVLMYFVYRFLKSLVTRILKGSKKVDAGLESLFLKTFAIVAWVFIFVMVLAQFGIDVTAFLAGLSIVGLAVGFAAKDSLENFISGITILIDH